MHTATPGPFLRFIFITILKVCVRACVHTHMHTLARTLSAGSLGMQKIVSDPLDLELLAVVSCLL